MSAIVCPQIFAGILHGRSPFPRNTYSVSGTSMHSSMHGRFVKATLHLWYCRYGPPAAPQECVGAVGSTSHWSGARIHCLSAPYTCAVVRGNYER